MRFYTTTHQYYCGIDLHARVMYLCIINSDGETVLHKNMKAEPDALLKAIQKYRSDIVIGVECVFTWYWIADLCAEEGIPFVLGHALVQRQLFLPGNINCRSSCTVHESNSRWKSQE